MNIGDVITTAEELDALAQYSVVADDTGETWIKDPIGMWVCSHGDAADADEVVQWCTRPLTVVALPSRPERVVKAEALREAAAELSDDNGPSRAGLVLLDMADLIEAGER